MYKNGIVYSCFLVLFLSSTLLHGQAINGNGTIVKKTLHVNGYSSIALKSSSDIVFVENTTKDIVIEADEKFIPYIECVVINNCLTIRNKNEAWFNLVRPIKIFIPASRQIEKIMNNGSGDISSNQTCTLENDRMAISSNGSGNITLKLKCNQLELKLSGSSDAKLSGTADHIAIQSNGSGDIEGSKLVAKDIDIRIGGSSSAKLNCTSTLHAVIHGSSDIYVTGNPVITADKNRDSIHLVKN